MSPSHITRQVDNGYVLGPHNNNNNGNIIASTKPVVQNTQFRTVRVSSALNPNPIFIKKSIVNSPHQQENINFVDNIVYRDPDRSEDNLNFRAVRNSIVAKGYSMNDDPIKRKSTLKNALEKDIKRNEIVSTLMSRNDYEL